MHGIETGNAVRKGQIISGRSAHSSILEDALLVIEL